MQVPLKPLFSVETKCFVGLLNALWTLNSKPELGSEVSQRTEVMEETLGTPGWPWTSLCSAKHSNLSLDLCGEVCAITDLVKVEPELISMLCSRTSAWFVSQHTDPSAAENGGVWARALLLLCLGVALPHLGMSWCPLVLGFTLLISPFLIPGNRRNNDTICESKDVCLKTWLCSWCWICFTSQVCTSDIFLLLENNEKKGVLPLQCS